MRYLTPYELARWNNSKQSTCRRGRYKRCRFNRQIRKIPWGRKWQPAPIFLPGKFHGQRSLVGYNPWGHKELDMTEHGRTHVLLHVTLEWVCYTSSVSEVGKCSSHAVNDGQCREERNTCDQVMQYAISLTMTLCFPHMEYGNCQGKFLIMFVSVLQNLLGYISSLIWYVGFSFHMSVVASI